MQRVVKYKYSPSFVVNASYSLPLAKQSHRSSGLEETLRHQTSFLVCLCSSGSRKWACMPLQTGTSLCPEAPGRICTGVMQNDLKVTLKPQGRRD